MEGKFVTKTLAANVDAAESSAALSVEELKNVTVHVVQRVDAGTVTLQVEYSHDGTVWVPLGSTVAESGFAAGADTAVERPLETSNGMSIRTKYVRLTATAHTGGEYDLVIGGEQRPHYG